MNASVDVAERSKLQRLRAWRTGAVLVPSIIILLVVRDRLFVSPDSTQYLSAARNVVAGRGLASYWWSGRAEPLTHFPPLYPFILSLFGRVGMDIERAAVWLNLACIATVVWQSSRLAARVVGGTVIERARSAAIAACAIAVANDLIGVGAMLDTEPLFIAVSLFALGTLASTIERQRDGRTTEANRAFSASAACCAVDALTRFVGLALIGACALALLVYWRGPLVSRLRRALVYSCLAGAPLAAWLLYNHLRHASLSNRELALHPIGAAEVASAMITVSHWLSPYVPWRMPRFALFIVICVSLIAVVLGIWRVGVSAVFHADAATSRGVVAGATEYRSPSSATAAVMIVFWVVYTLFLITSISIADVSTPLDSRILSPLLPLAVVLSVSAVLLLRRQPAPSSRFASFSTLTGVTLGCAYAIGQVAGLAVWTRTARAEGVALNRDARAAPALLARVRSLPSGAAVYSNMPDLIYYFTGRVVHGMPQRFSPTSLRANANFDGEVAGMSRDGLATYVVLFDAGSDRPYAASLGDLRSHLSNIRVDTMSGGYFSQLSAQPTHKPVR
jgi:hypothetical protein